MTRSRAPDVRSYGRKAAPGTDANMCMEPDLHHRPGRRVEPHFREWRRRVLRQAGFPEELANRLADDRDADLHGLLKLVDRGCPPELTARILAPL